MRLPHRPLPTLLFCVTASALLVGGCKRRPAAEADAGTAAITIANASDGGGQSVSIAVPGFATKVKVPDLHLGSGTMQIEDIKLFPGTRVDTVDVRSETGDGSGGETRGNVAMRFSASASADAIVDYYRTQTQQAGWTIAPPGGDEQFAATKRNDHGGTTRFGLQVMPGTDTSSTGRFTVAGR